MHSRGGHQHQVGHQSSTGLGANPITGELQPRSWHGTNPHGLYSSIFFKRYDVPRAYDVRLCGAVFGIRMGRVFFSSLLFHVPPLLLPFFVALRGLPCVVRHFRREVSSGRELRRHSGDSTLWSAEGLVTTCGLLLAVSMDGNLGSSS